MAESTVLAAANAELRKVEAAIAKKICDPAPDAPITPTAQKTIEIRSGQAVVTAVHAICRCGRPLARYAESKSMFGQCLSYFQMGEFATPNCSRNIGGETKNEKGETVSVVLWNAPAQQVPADKQPLML